MLMKYVIVFVLLHANAANAIAMVEEETALLCPGFCHCDLYGERNRAVCSGKRLIDPDVDIPSAVEILDLSYNDITQLDNSCFANYRYLLNLNLSYNAVQTIYLNAFAQLNRVHTIDLSYNRLETLDERIVEMNRQLHTLNLAGNKFTAIPNKPLIRSSSLRVLNLAKSQIGYITTTMFEGVPQLLELDVSQNLMISLNPMALNVLHQLSRIDLDGNPWNCDKALMKTVEVLGRRNVNVSLIDCSPKSQRRNHEHEFAEYGQQFEKIVVPLESQGGVPVAHGVDTQVIREWRVPPPVQNREHSDDNDADDDDGGDDEDVSNGDELLMNWHEEISETKRFLGYPPIAEFCNGAQKPLCQRYREYLINASQMLLKKLNSEATPKGSLPSDTYTKTDLYFVFALGATVGISVVVFIWSCTLGCHKPYNKRATHIDLPPSNARSRSPSTSPSPSPQRSRPQTRAVPPRRQRRYAPSRPPTAPSQRDVVRSASVPSNFLTGLFGRPARHQYYRTINENTAILIRRLSRSNLFNSRDRDRDRERERERNRTCAAEHAQNANDDVEGDHLIVIVSGGEGGSRADRPTAGAATRSETPPPSYGEVFVGEQQQQK